MVMHNEGLQPVRWMCVGDVERGILVEAAQMGHFGRSHERAWLGTRTEERRVPVARAIAEQEAALQNFEPEPVHTSTARVCGPRIRLGEQAADPGEAQHGKARFVEGWYCVTSISSGPVSATPMLRCYLRGRLDRGQENGIFFRPMELRRGDRS
jgi:hypothetical protein